MVEEILSLLKKRIGLLKREREGEYYKIVTTFQVDKQKNTIATAISRLMAPMV